MDKLVVRTTTKQVRNQIKDYVLQSIDGDSYDVEFTDDKHRIQFLRDTFLKEYVHENNQHLPTQKLFIDWVQGLPNSFSVVFYNYDIIKKLNKWAGTELDINDKNEHEYLENYWYLLFREFSALCRKHNIDLR